MKFRPLFLVISLSLLLTSAFSILKWGFKTSIDFAGGSVWEFSLQDGQQQKLITSTFDTAKISINSFSVSANRYLLKFKNISPEDKTKVESALKKADSSFVELKYETLSPIIGKELLSKTIFAIVLSSLSLLLFIGKKFSNFSFGLGAILAMFHDSFILIGSFSLLGHFFGAELDTLFVTALLTTLSASVHDTVVTFDRMRELGRTYGRLPWVDLANRAVTETLVRSVNNSMTIVFMLLSLVILGGDSTRWFATALLIGVICGTYSSTAVAIPLVLFFKRQDSRQ